MAVTIKQTKDVKTADPINTSVPRAVAKPTRKKAAGRRALPKKRGRKPRTPKYDRAVFDRVCALVATGRTLTEVLASDAAFPSRVEFYAVKKASAGLQATYEAAQEAQRGVFADEVLTLLDAVQGGDVVLSKGGKTQSNYARDRITLAREKANNRKWLLSRLDPAFKDVSKIEHGGKVDGQTVVITLTGGLPDQPLGELATQEEKNEAIREARRTRHITREMIDNPFGIDIARDDGYRDDDYRAEQDEGMKTNSPKLRGEL